MHSAGDHLSSLSGALPRTPARSLAGPLNVVPALVLDDASLDVARTLSLSKGRRVEGSQARCAQRAGNPISNMRRHTGA
jgi:hypothetical protein